PVMLKKGANEFLFHVARGRLQAKLTEPKSELFLDASDAILPDIVAGESFKGWGAVLVVNAAPKWQDSLVLTQSVESKVPRLPPLSVTKVPFVIAGPFTESGEKAHFELSLGRMEPHKALNSLNLSLQVVKPGETHRRTFLSRIDGSVQYYSLVPAIPDAKTTPGLTLTLHGAAVEASGQ